MQPRTAPGWAAPWATAGVRSGSSIAGVTALALVVMLGLTGWSFRDQLGLGRTTAVSPVVPIPPSPTSPESLNGTDRSGTQAADGSSPTAAASRLVDLAVLRVRAQATAPPGQDASKAPVTYEAENMLDGHPTTAWRTVGDGTGLRLTFRFGSPVHIRRVGLIPGYAKVDPHNHANRFEQERRITDVDWDFGDGTHAEQHLQDDRALQSVAVDATTSSVTLTILGTTPPGSDRDYTAISDVRFRGTP